MAIALGRLAVFGGHAAQGCLRVTILLLALVFRFARRRQPTSGAGR